MKKYKFITIEQDPTGGYKVRNDRGQDLLGYIDKYRPWRNQWTFFPKVGTVWSLDCLEDVIDFIKNEIPKEKK